jgi:hypothetical protein
VTRRRQAIYIPEFRDIEELPDGTWTAMHEGGKVIKAPTLRRLEYVEAPATRIAYALRRRGGLA